jgi:hypothetical protein
MSFAKTFAAVCVIATLTALGVTIAEEPQKAWCSKKSNLAWDVPALNEDGTPCTDLAGFAVALSDPAVDMNAGGAALAQVWVNDAAITQQALEPMFTTLPGGPYRLWALAFDLAGNESVWSDPLEVTYDPTKPNKPIKLRIK